MVIKYNDIFYKFIETFISYGRPDLILKDETFANFNDDIIAEYKKIRREELDYFKASMILLDGQHFTDDAFIYFFPMLVKHILDHNGHIDAVILRLRAIDMTKYSENEVEVINKMAEALDEMKQNYNDDSNEIILMV